MKTYQIRYVASIEFTRDVQVPDLVEIEDYMSEHEDDPTDVRPIVDRLNAGEFEVTTISYVRTDRIE